MKRDVPSFSDNTLVFRGKDYNEYLGLSLRALEEDDWRNWEVYIYRYCVPGRCDTYSFTWNKRTNLGPNKVEYFSDSWNPLLESCKMAARDFNKKRVVEMFVNAMSAERVCLYYRHDLMNLLGVIAPKSETYKALTKLIEKTMKERADRLVREKQVSREVADRVLKSI